MELTLNTLSKKILINSDQPLKKIREFMKRSFPDTWQEFTLIIKEKDCDCEKEKIKLS